MNGESDVNPLIDSIFKNRKGTFICIMFSVTAFEFPEGFVVRSTNMSYGVRAEIFDSTMIEYAAVVRMGKNICISFDFRSEIGPENADLIDHKAIEILNEKIKNNDECKLKYGTSEYPVIFCSFTYGRNAYGRATWRL